MSEGREEERDKTDRDGFNVKVQTAAAENMAVLLTHSERVKVVYGPWNQ